MRVSEAADIWIEGKRHLDKLHPAFDTAKEVLLEHFEKTGKTEYRGEIGFSKTNERRLDQKAVKEHFGRDVERFMKDTPKRQLSLLK